MTRSRLILLIRITTLALACWLLGMPLSVIAIVGPVALMMPVLAGVTNNCAFCDGDGMTQLQIDIGCSSSASTDCTGCTNAAATFFDAIAAGGCGSSNNTTISGLTCTGCGASRLSYLFNWTSAAGNYYGLGGVTISNSVGGNSSTVNFANDMGTSKPVCIQPSPLTMTFFNYSPTCPVTAKPACDCGMVVTFT